ncbi:MAG: hypothetical protein AAF215_25590 [Cyanobacteria bacterium P01_A01_bin.123]
MSPKLATLSFVITVLLISFSCTLTSPLEGVQDTPPTAADVSDPISQVPSPLGSTTQGRAPIIIIENLLNCSMSGARISAVGTITAADGTDWIVPAENNFEAGPKAADLYNECLQITYNSVQEVDLESIPVAEIDPDGEIITGYIFADNYFELYVNGELVAVDPVPFTPFNSSIVRFRVKKPITYAVKLIDWEENLGLGTESNQGSDYHPGDGGFVASFSDGTVTDASWRAQTFYIAPLENPQSVREDGNVRDSSDANAESPNCDESCYALHYPVPEDWFSESFDDAGWPEAVTYSNETVGVNNKRSYTNFSDVFIGANAEFIWSSNLVLDNLVLARKTVQ